ncbi:MAG: ornithine decarboxylase, partial [Lentimonas sp.]
MEYDGVSNICYLDFSKGKIESSVKSQINSLKPAIPTHVVRLENVDRAAKWFLNNFNGKVLYSVKSNPEEKVLLQLHKSGVEDFDIASLNEIKLISRILPQAKMYFMHPIKSREAIFEAYFNYGIRDFSLDSHDELDKILAETNNAKDLSLHIRLSIPNSHAAIELSSKFGILPSDSVSLIRKARISAKTLGICFHVGSQCMEP